MIHWVLLGVLLAAPSAHAQKSDAADKKKLTRAIDKLNQQKPIDGLGLGPGDGRARGAALLGASNLRVTLGHVDGDLGGLELASIKPALTPVLSRAQRCFQSAGHKKPELTGAVFAKWGVSAKGKVRRARIASSTLRSRRVRRCLLRAIRKVHFPIPPAGKARLAVGFVFAQEIRAPKTWPPPTKPKAPPQQLGGLTQEQIAEVMEKHKRAFRNCYERRLEIKSSIRGKVVFRWSINARGKVVGARVDRSLLSDVRVEDCLLRRIRTLRFPSPPAGKATVRFPFIFAPEARSAGSILRLWGR